AGLYGLPPARLGRSSALSCSGEGVGPLPGRAMGWHRGRPHLVAAPLAPSAAAELARPHRRALRRGLPGADCAGLAPDGLGGSRIRQRLLALCALRATGQRPALSRHAPLDGTLSLAAAAAVALAGALTPARRADGAALRRGAALLRRPVGQRRVGWLTAGGWP